MSNNVYNDSLYNTEVKDRFLKLFVSNSYSENTLIAVKRVLARAGRMERRLEKDLFDFRVPEIEQFLISLNPTSLSSAIQAVNIIENYIKWGIDEHLTRGNLNPLDIFTTKELAERVVSKRAVNIFSYDKVQDAIKRTVNDQDKALVLALFFGIVGKQLCEISDLKIQDIDQEDNIINIMNSEYGRQLKLESKEQRELIGLLTKAFEQEKYKKNNGKRGKIKSPERPLVQNEHIFKPMVRTTTNDGHTEVTGVASYFVLRSRLVTLADQFDMPAFVAMNIRNSGMLFFAYQEYKANGEKLTKESKKKIYEFYGIHKSKSKDIFNAHVYERDFLNEETIRATYYQEQ